MASTWCGVVIATTEAQEIPICLLPNGLIDLMINRFENLKMNTRNLLMLVLFFSATVATAQRIQTENLRKHIYYLADDDLKGRAPGTGGEKKAANYVAKHFREYGIEPKGSKGYFQTFNYRQSLNPHDTASQKGKKRVGKNIVGFLNNDAATTVVIGAHYDHLGDDGRGSSLDKDPEGKVHNGADDNASGTAGVIELARYFAGNGVKEKVNFLFMCFSAEEAGLIGSKYFTNNPTVELSSVNFMFNMDMVGRLVDSTNKLLVFGTGTSDVFEDKLKATNRNRFQLVLDSSGVGPSDQTSFYLKKIPVLHFFTGQHSDYHKPSDDADKINYPGETKVLEYMIDLIENLTVLPKLKFYETRSKDSGAKTSFKVTLGVMPDYGFQGKGLRIDAVNKDKPAEKAGLQAGDVVVKIGDAAIENIYDYMKVLSKHAKGETVDVEALRSNKPVVVKLTF
jgi:hypothetical protein